MSEREQPARVGVTAEELAAQAAADLPSREAMTLIDPGLVSGAQSPMLTGADQTAGDAGSLAGQASADASDLGSQTTQTATDTASAQPAGGTYQPSVTSVARS